MATTVSSRVDPRRLLRRRGEDAAQSPSAVPTAKRAPYVPEAVLDLEARRDQLRNRVAELQWDLGGTVYEMAIRNSVHVDVLVKRAAVLQDADAELQEVERILASEQSATAGQCSKCGAPHSSGAAFCWQCGGQIMHSVDTSAIFGRDGARS